MKKMYLTGAAVLLIVCLVAALAYRLGGSDRSRTATPLGTLQSLNLIALSEELKGIRAAEMIEDPLERCLAYPNPPEFQWDRKVVEALCRKAQWRMLTSKQIDDALDQRHPEILDQAFDSYFASNYSDADRHGFLTWAFWWMFQSSSKWAADTTQKWVKTDPQSAYALAARGIHYTQAAYDARGGKTERNTPKENFARMSEFAHNARTDLQESLHRNPRLIAAYHSLIRLSRLDGTAEERRQWVDQALVLDPADPWTYQDWMDAVEPQWGGSTAEMERVAESAGKHASANPLLSTLRAGPLCNVADDFRCEECERDGAKSLDFFRQAGGFGPAACFLEGAGAAAVLAQDSQTAVRYYSQAVRFIGGADWLAYRAPALRSIGQNEWALQDLKNALALNPRNTTVLYSEGLAYAEMGRIGDAQKTYLSILIIDPNNQQAALALSILYLTNSSPLFAPEKARPLIGHLLDRDPTLAHAWLLQAAVSEIDRDASAYVNAAENYLKFVDHDDPAHKNDIEVILGKVAQVREIQRNQAGAGR
jgi:tetratricopeptide (TPR) repeat protein